MHDFRYAILVVLLMIAANVQLRATGNTEKEDVCDSLVDSCLLSCGKDAQGRICYGLRMGGKGGVMQPAFSKDSDYVAVITCDTTKRGKVGKAAQISVYSSAVTKTELWKRKINPKTQVSVNGRYLTSVMKMESSEDKVLRDFVEFRSIDKGEVKSFIQTNPIYINDTLDIVLGLGNGAFPNLSAYKISDGSRLWTNEEWTSGNQRCYTQLYDKRTLFVVADNLYMINLATGQIRKKKIDSFRKEMNVPGFVGGFVGGLMGGLLAQALFGGHTLYIPLYYSYKTYGYLGSNICVDNRRIYVADCSNLYCLDNSLNEIWKTKFESAGSSSSELRLESGVLSVFAHGCGMGNEDNKVASGKPFYMQCDIETGGKLMKQIFSEKKNCVCDTLMQNNRLKTILLPNSIVQIKNITDSLETIDYSKDIYGKFQCFIRNDMYLGGEWTTKLKPLEREGRFFVNSSKDSIYVFTDEGRVAYSYSAESAFIKVADFGEFLCVKDCRSEGSRYLIVDNNFNVKARLDDDTVSVYKFADGIIVVRTKGVVFMNSERLKSLLP